MIGIYKITNIINNKCYYGSSKNVEKRWRDHKNQLNRNSHINSKLQRAWNKYGENSFIFEIVEECEKTKLFEIEQKYLNLEPDYNIGINACGGDNLTNNPNRDKIIEKIKKGSKLWRDSLSDVERNEIFSKPLDKNPNWRGGVTYQYCECGIRIGTGHKHCNKCRPRSNNKNPFFGKTHSDTVKNKQSERMKGNIPKNREPIFINGVEYNSYHDASIKLGIPAVTIRWRVLSKNPKYKNYKFKNKENFTYTDNEQKERLSKPQINSKRNHNKPFLIDNVEYQTLKDASEKLKIHQMTIKGRLISSKFDNYKYIT